MWHRMCIILNGANISLLSFDIRAVLTKQFTCVCSYNARLEKRTVYIETYKKLCHLIVRVLC